MRDNLVKYNLSYAFRYKLDEGIMGNVLANKKRNGENRYQREESTARYGKKEGKKRRVKNIREGK